MPAKYKILAVALMSIPLSGCVVASVAETAVGTVVDVTTGTVGAAADLVIGGDDGDESEDQSTAGSD